MKLNCLVIDDEPMARKGLQEYVDEVEFLNRVASCENALKALPYLTDQKIDLIYLDIHMPQLSGIEFLRTLKRPPLTIFTTAFSDYAIEGYALDVVDYLVKPITFDRFLRASQKAREFYQLRARAENDADDVDYFFVRCDRRFEKVFFREISYIEALQNYAIIHLPDRKLISYITLTSLENQLPRQRFVKVHKSYVVSIAHIRTIDGSEILIGESRIPISRNLRDKVVQEILGNKLFKR